MSEDQELLSLRLNSNGSVEDLEASQSKEEYIREQADKINQAVINNDLERVKQIMAHLQVRDILKILTSKELGLPILVATEHDSKECLEYFLTLNEKHGGMKLDVTDGFVESRTGQNAFHLMAMQQKSTEVVDILEGHVESLKDIIDKPDSNNLTPLLTAVKNNNTKVAKLLVRRDACFHQNFGIGEKGQGESAINIAITSGQCDVLEEMVKKASSKKILPELYINSELFGDKHTIFYAAAISGKDEIFEYLLEQIEENDSKNHLNQEMKHWENEKFLKSIITSSMKSAMGALMKLDNFLAKQIASYTPLFWAVKSNQLEIVKLILDDDKDEMLTSKLIRAENVYGKTVIHYAAALNDSAILNFFMSKDGDSSLYMHRDKRGCTPLHHAAVANSTENVKLLLARNFFKMNKESIFHCECCIKHCSYEILQLILKKIEECAGKTNFPRFLRTENGKQRAPLHQAAYAGKTEILQLLLEKNTSIVLRSTYFNWTVLHFAVAGGSLETVDFLLKKRKKLMELRTNNDETATALAAEDGHPNILKFLLGKGGKIFGEYRRDNLLDAVTRHIHRNQKKRRNAALEIINFCDENGGIDLLEKLMKQSMYGTEGIMSKLVKQMPSVAVQILERCSKNIDSVDAENTHKYYLFPIQDKTRKDNDSLKAIRTMVKYKRYECLNHPVVAKFLDEKWNNSTARIWYISNIVLYAAFLFSLTGYIGIQRKARNTFTSSELITLSVVCLVVISCNIIKEISQIRYNWKDYLLEANNYLEWAVYISAAVYLIPPNKQKTDEQIQAGAVAVLLAWINFIWFFKRLSLFGIYIIMAKKVFMSLLKVLPMIFLFIFAFSMAFYLLMSNDEGYVDIPLAMLTTSVMMVGEIDYRSVFLGDNISRHIVLTRLFLFCFLIIITIVIMNLLVGLAVGDTDDTMKRSKAEKRFCKAALIVSLQRQLSHVPYIELIQVPDPLKVNVKAKLENQPWYVKLWEMVYKDNQLDEEDISEKILSRLENMESSMVRNVNVMQKSIAQMKEQMEKISKQIGVPENKSEDTA